MNTIQIKRGTASGLVAANPTPADGELVYETDTAKFKIGDGSTAYISLPYLSLGGGESGSSSYGSQLLFG